MAMKGFKEAYSRCQVKSVTEPDQGSRSAPLGSGTGKRRSGVVGAELLERQGYAHVADLPALHVHEDEHFLAERQILQLLSLDRELWPNRAAGKRNSSPPN